MYLITSSFATIHNKMITNCFRGVVGIGVWIGFLATFHDAHATPHNTVVLQGLDKVTARVHTFEAPLGSVVRFGTLEIITRHCDKRPPEETPESAAFVDISEVRHGEPTTNVFRGWMFASSPALSALEHPVYDVWVLDCRGEITDPQVPDKKLPN